MEILPNRIAWPSSRTGLLRRLILLALLLHLSNVAVAEPISPSGAAIANACATCHGPDGRSQGAIPSIDVLSKESLVIALRAFQSGERQGTIMNRIIQGLDAEEIEAVAAYLGSRGQR